MSNAQATIYVIRHGETAWSLSGQHTGRTDVPLTDRGRESALRLRERLAGIPFAIALTSPSQRASNTCELAGFGSAAQVDGDLVEWDYGDYEGLRSAEIHADRPQWELFRDGCPGGESPSQVSERADRVLKRLRAVDGNAMVFSSGHFIRALAARWVGMELTAGRHLMVSTASVGALGYENDISRPVIRFWNETVQRGEP